MGNSVPAVVQLIYSLLYFRKRVKARQRYVNCVPANGCTYEQRREYVWPTLFVDRTPEDHYLMDDRLQVRRQQRLEKVRAKRYSRKVRQGTYRNLPMEFKGW